MNREPRKTHENRAISAFRFQVSSFKFQVSALPLISCVSRLKSAGEMHREPRQTHENRSETDLFRFQVSGFSFFPEICSKKVQKTVDASLAVCEIDIAHGKKQQHYT